MSGLRSIEMQVALPRTQTAGKIQDQMQQRSMVAQEHLAQSQEEKDVKRKKTVTESDKAEHEKLNSDDESEGRGGQYRGKSRHREDDGEEQTIKHPYKGVRFDASC